VLWLIKLWLQAPAEERDGDGKRRRKILEQLGVTLNREKTRIVHVAHGFEFLGFKIKRGKRQFKLSRDRIKSKLNRQNLYAIPTQKAVDRDASVRDFQLRTPQWTVARISTALARLDRFS
jgi:hypothetical protein